MKRTPLQTELPLAPSGRVKLVDDSEEVKLRNAGDPYGAMMARTAAEPLMDAVKRREALVKGVSRGLDAAFAPSYTPWFTNFPPMSGLYEVRQKSARLTTIHLRLWYDAGTKLWSNPMGIPARGRVLSPLPIPHSTLMHSHFWRGISKPAAEGYSYYVPAPGRVILLEQP